MHGVRRHVLLALAWVPLALPVGARADVDMNGPWGVDNGFLGYNVATFVQSGTSLSMYVGSIPGEPQWSGSIDLSTGQFTMTGPSPVYTGCNPDSVISATVAPDGKSFSGTFMFEYASFMTMQCGPIESSIVGRRCGNGVLDPGEQCDDGNFADTDCCSSSCQFTPADTPCTGSNVCRHHACDGMGACVPTTPNDGASCDDGLFCNGTETCSGGTCGHSGDPCTGQDACHRCDEPSRQCLSPSGTRCGPCQGCDGNGACGIMPVPFSCKGGGAASQLTIINRTPDTKDRLAWKWSEGGATTLAELGNPRATDDYALCVYDVSYFIAPYVLLFAARVPAGGGWHATGAGFRYRNTSGTPDGIRSVRLVAGSAERAKVSVGGKGEFLPLGAAGQPLPLPLLVQLENSAGACWGAQFYEASSNDGTVFEAR